MRSYYALYSRNFNYALYTLVQTRNDNTRFSSFLTVRSHHNTIRIHLIDY